MTTTNADLEGVIASAFNAKASLSTQDPKTRSVQLELAATRLDEAAEDLVPIAIEESHLTEQRLRGELKRTTFQLRMFAAEVRRAAYLDVRIDYADPEYGMGPRPDIRRYGQALGVVLNFAASNFPFAFSVAGGDTASALAAGCPVIVKAHEGHPALSEATARVLEGALLEAGAPQGTFSLIQGREAGLCALADDRIDGATFTGSVKAGLFLARIASERHRPIPFYGELGSINPVVVTRQAIHQRASEIVTGFVESFTLGSGQFCTKPGLIFLPSGHGLEDEIIQRCHLATTGRLLTESITQSFAERTEILSSELKGQMVIAGDGSPMIPRPTLMMVSMQDFLSNVKNLTTEVFGPFAVVVSYADEVELLKALSFLEGTLTATIHGEPEDASLVSLLMECLAGKAGRMIYNGWPTGVSVTNAQQHGGPHPASTSLFHTSVGSAAMQRFLVPIAFQGFPEELLPSPVKTSNPWTVPQQINPSD